MTQPYEMKMSIPPASEFVGVVRLAISGVATRMNFTIEDIEDIKISISEACTNAIQHAYSDSTENGFKIDITTRIFIDKLEIVVQDFGKGFDTSILGTVEQKEKSQEKLGLGLGLTFIRSLMDTADIQSEIGKGTTVTMQKAINPTESLSNA